MKNYLSDPITVFMSLATVYLLGFIGIALLCILFIARLVDDTAGNAEHKTKNAGR